ncbi:MAG: hypothetical protein ACI3Z8_07590 [Paludibacteraceae bacterium]
MKKVTSLFAVLCIAVSAFAQPRMTEGAPAPKSNVFLTPSTTNALNQRVMERMNAEKEERRVSMRPAAVQAEGDTIHLEAQTCTIWNPEAEPNKWGLGAWSGNYKFDLTWISETMTGVFDKEDLAAGVYVNYIWKYDEGANKVLAKYTFEEIELVVAYESLSGLIQQLNIDAKIKAVDKQGNVAYFTIHADREDVFARDTVVLNVPNADVYEILGDSAFLMQGNAEDGTRVSVSLLTPTFPGEGFYLSYFNRPLTFVEYYKDGDTVRYEAIKDDQGLAADVDNANTVQNGKVFDLDAQFLAADTVLYMVKMHHELPTPKDTVVIEINNMMIDGSNAADGGGYYTDGYTDDYHVELLTLSTSGTHESPNMAASIQRLTYDNQANLMEMWGKVVFTNHTSDSTTVYAEVIANDHVLYQISMCSRMDAVADTIVKVMPGHCTVVTDQMGGWQFYQETDSFAVSTVFYADDLREEDYYARNGDILTTATFFYRKGAGQTWIEERLADVACHVRPNATQDTIFFVADMTTYVGRMYEVHMAYYKPVPKDTVDVTIDKCKFSDGRETNGAWSLFGITEDEHYFVMISPRGDSLEGRWEKDYLFTRDEFYYAYQAFYIITEGEDGQLQQTAVDFVDGWLESSIARDTIFVEAEFLCTDDNYYRFHLAVDTRYRLAYDCEDKEDALYFEYKETDRCYVSDVAHKEYNMLYWVGNSYHEGEKTGLLTQVVFYSDEKDPDITIPEGVYPIDYSEESGTVLASYGVQTNGAYPSLAAWFEDTMIKDGVVKDLLQPLYFFTQGQVTVKKLDGKRISIEVEAMNSYDVPIHITYEGTPVTAVEETYIDEQNDALATKFIQDGALYIQRGERVYNVLGGVVRQ